jgi:hypothetical protein
MSRRTALPLILILASSLAVGCVHRSYDGDGGPGRGYGPPPHAPAHGYRAKYQGRDLEFDSNTGVYVVVGLPDLFWCDGWYHRRLGDRWQRSDDWNGPWYDSTWDDVPPGLRGGKGKGMDKGQGQGQGKGKDKSW